MNKKELLDALKQQVSDNITLAQALLTEATEVLNDAPSPGTWSVLRIVEHLNTYNSYYVPKIKGITLKGARSSANTYKPGMLGNYFVEMMEPVNGVVIRKYKASKQHLPQIITDTAIIQTYISSQQELLDCIDRSVNIDLVKNKIPVSISPLIKLRLGDVYRFLVAHQQRHFVQINNTLKQLSVSPQYQQ